MNYLATLETHLGARYSPHTRRAYRRSAETFIALAGTKQSYSREQVLAFIDHLIDEGMLSQSIIATVAGLRKMFDACSLVWPLQRGDLRLGLPQVEPEAPILSNVEVFKLIRGVRATKGLPRAIIALSTTFGLRADEIVRALAKGCDGKTLDVQTAKGGKLRHHNIPPILRDALHFGLYDVSDRYLHSVFEKLMTHYVRPPRHREGLHSIRRAVVTELLNAGVEEKYLHAFMGWKSSATHSIVYRYWHPAQSEVEAVVYARHPWLIAWPIPPPKLVVASAPAPRARAAP